MENIQPQASMEVVHNNINSGVDLEQETQELHQEQELLEQQQETITSQDKEEVVVTKEILVMRMEKISLRIIEIEEEKKREETILTQFLQRYKAIQSFMENPVEQMKILISEKLLESLPKEIVTEIKTNYEKYNFIDYKLVEESLKKDEFSEELESLSLEQEQGQEQITVFETQEKIISEQKTEIPLQENEATEEISILKELDSVTGEESSFNLGSELENAPFGGNAFEVIKGGVTENLSSTIERAEEGLENATQGVGKAFEVVGEIAGSVTDGLSNAA